MQTRIGSRPIEMRRETLEPASLAQARDDPEQRAEHQRYQDRARERYIDAQVASLDAQIARQAAEPRHARREPQHEPEKNQDQTHPHQETSELRHPASVEHRN